MCSISVVLYNIHVGCDCGFFFQAEDGIRDLVRSRGLGDVYKRQVVVTEADLVGRDRVVLVDDRDDAEVEELLKGALLSLIHI